jgi:hypothetical protein
MVSYVFSSPTILLPSFSHLYRFSTASFWDVGLIDRPNRNGPILLIEDGWIYPYVYKAPFGGKLFAGRTLIFWSTFLGYGFVFDFFFL